MLRHLLHLHDFTPNDLVYLLDLADYLKAHPEAVPGRLQGKSLLMLFEKNSTRTHLSFEVGMKQLGGNTVYTRREYTNFNITDVWDETRVISSYVDLILARVRKHEDLVEMADASKVPVINGCDDRFHPTQALADIMTIREVLGTLDKVRVVYLGIGNNVSNSLAQATLLAGGTFTLCAPQIDPAAFDKQIYAKWTQNNNYSTNNKPEFAVRQADVLYTDTWINMEFFEDPAYESDRQRRIKMMRPYQLNEDVLEMTSKDDTLIMHCMPVHKGYEVNDTIVYHDNSVVFQQAENRLYVQQALMLWLLDAV